MATPATTASAERRGRSEALPQGVAAWAMEGQVDDGDDGAVGGQLRKVGFGPRLHDLHHGVRRVASSSASCQLSVTVRMRCSLPTVEMPWIVAGGTAMPAAADTSPQRRGS